MKKFGQHVHDDGKQIYAIESDSGTVFINKYRRPCKIIK